MALKSYHRETLNDNWYEERASPLNGVLPRDGAKEYLTTTGTDFSGAQPIVPRQKLRMINDGNIDEAIRQTAELDWSRGFRSVIPRPDPEPDRDLISTHRRAFINHFPTSPTSHAGAVIAGGPGGRKTERGKAASGAMGEVYKKSSEPQRDTLAQRSWMYSTDPMIEVMQKRAALGESQARSRPPSEEQSNNNGGSEGFGRRDTPITSIRKHHKGVFVDDEVEHQHLW